MPLGIGLIGMPNAGKSTVFNVLVRQPVAETASYPFCTVHPNRALLEVPDSRLSTLGRLAEQERQVKVRIEFIDIAGLVQGASRGEGLGNRFLHQIRECDALLHVLDCYSGPAEPEDSQEFDPAVRMQIIHHELMLSDAERLDKRLERLHREIKGDAGLRSQHDLVVQALADLEQGIMLRDSPVVAHPAFPALNAEMGLITAKPELVLANVDEDFMQDVGAEGGLVAALTRQGHKMVALCAKMEEELLDMSAVDEAEFRQAYGLDVSGLTRVVEGCFALLSLIRFYTLGDHEVRAWELRQGSSAVEGAAKIHTDFARGFIAADVVPFSVFARIGSERQVRSEGMMRSEGRDYTIQDGDVIRFKFNL